MRRLVIALGLAVAIAALACTFADDPAAGAFKCDADHPCPEDQRCVAGLCGGSSNNPTADGVLCGSAGVCAVGMRCCASPTTSLSCATSCSGAVFSATCDGLEDCGAGSACCGTTEVACGDASCSPRVCTTTADCADDGTTCCYGGLTLGPWGLCSSC